MIVRVHWHDAAAGSTVEEASNCYRDSVGYLIRRDDHGIVLSMEEDTLSGVHFIPAGMVLGVVELEACVYT